MSLEAYHVKWDKKEYRLIGENQGPLEEANVFLRSLEARGLSPRTIRAYTFDLLVLYRWMTKSEKTLCELSVTDLLEFMTIVAGFAEPERSPDQFLNQRPAVATGVRVTDSPAAYAALSSSVPAPAWQMMPSGLSIID